MDWLPQHISPEEQMDLKANLFIYQIFFSVNCEQDSEFVINALLPGVQNPVLEMMKSWDGKSCVFVNQDQKEIVGDKH